MCQSHRLRPRLESFVIPIRQVHTSAEPGSPTQGNELGYHLTNRCQISPITLAENFIRLLHSEIQLHQAN